MARCLILIVLLGLVSCGRPLTESERAFIGTIHGDTIDLDQLLDQSFFANFFRICHVYLS